VSVELLHGDCVELMRAMPENSVDSIVTDPPYGLEFMGKEWDAPWKSGEVVKVTDEATNGTFHTKGFKHGVRYSRGREEMLAFQEWFELVAAEALRVLKPGGHLLAFGGTRTYHRMACAIEDAGFEIRDSIHWVYGSGFPKSLNVGKAIDKTNGEGDRAWKFTGWMRTTGLTARQLDEVTGTNMGGHYLTAKSQPAIPTAALWAVIRPLCGEVPAWVDELVARVEAEREVVGEQTKARSESGSSALPTGGAATVYKTWDVTAPATDEARRWEGWGTALKPAHEPVVVARKPLSGTVAGNVLVWGTGGLNIDGCRVPSQDGYEKAWDRPVSTNIGAGGQGNYISDGSQHTIDISNNKPEGGRWPANIVLDGAAAAALDQQSGVSVSKVGPRPGARGRSEAWTRPAHAEYGDDVRGHSDSGGASRFFTQADFGPDDWPFVYQAKPSRRERNAGLDGLPEKHTDFGGQGKPGAGFNEVTHGKAPQAAANHHPTVKPVALMRHLVRLVTPPGGTVLDPFAGSGTTLVAAVLEGFDAIGCEMTDEYLPIIEGRVAWAEEQRDSEQPRLL
jgi:DNA modification methylase